MRPLRCILGRHRAIWVPVIDTTTLPGASPWTSVRRCADCGEHLDRKNAS